MTIKCHFSDNNRMRDRNYNRDNNKSSYGRDNRNNTSYQRRDQRGGLGGGGGEYRRRDDHHGGGGGRLGEHRERLNSDRDRRAPDQHQPPPPRDYGHREPKDLEERMPKFKPAEGPVRILFFS